MKQILNFIDQLPLVIIIVIALTLGLAPFFPQPHVAEKLSMLFAGTLSKPIDFFDLLLHGIPWILLVVKLFRMATGSAR